MTANTNSGLPDFAELLFETSLYAGLPVLDDDHDKIEKLRKGGIQLDAYCIRCKRGSIFKSFKTINSGTGAKRGAVISSTEALDLMLQQAPFTTQIVCQRCALIYTYYFRFTDTGLTKVGQYPSMEDILSHDLQPYRKLLRPEDFAELHRAGGLYSHGIGIASFVYLRRIFERLIGLHYNELEKEGKPVPGFWEKRMDEKIQALASVLPPALVKYKKTYAILSKGLHELDEDTCRRFYPVVRAAIIRILDQDLQARKAAEAEEELDRQVNAIHQKVQGGEKAAKA